MTGDFALDMLKMVGTLILLSVLAVALLYLLKKMRIRAFTAAGSGEMRLLGMLHLAPKKAIALVEVCGERLVVALGADTVTFLTKLEPPGDGESGQPPESP
jgi:flagellar biogenesis protein FliO